MPYQLEYIDSICIGDCVYYYLKVEITNAETKIMTFVK
jgi:hypothetical protein